MSQDINYFPFERLSKADKRKDNNDWFKKVANYIIANSEINNMEKMLLIDRNTTDLGELDYNNKKALFKTMSNIYHNRIPQSFFSQFLKTKKTKSGTEVDVPDLPARIRAMNILSPNINYLNSKYKRQPFIFNVTNIDTESFKEYKEELHKFKQQEVRKRFLQEVKAEDGSVQQQDMTPEGLTTSFSESYKDRLAYKGEKILKRTLSDTGANNKLVTCFLDYLIKGEPLTFKTLINGKVEYKVCEIDNFYYDETKEYAQDSDWGVYIETVSIHDVTRDYRLLEKDWEELELMNGYNKTMGHNSTFLKYHVVWKGLEKIGTVYYNDEMNQPQKKEVDDEYEVQDGEDIEWRWDSILHEVTRFGNNVFSQIGDYPYLGINKTGKKSLVLPYSSFRFAHRTNIQYSVLSIGIPYLVLYVIANYIAEACLFKHKGKVLVINMSNIPKSKGWNREKVEDFLDKKGILYIDKNQATSDGTFNQYTSIDLGQLDQIMQLYNLSETYKNAWDDIIGVPREVRGQVMASQQVGNTKQAIQQSSLTIDYVYQKFDAWVELELQGLLELGKIERLLSGNSELLSPDDETYELLQIDREFLMSALGIRVTDSGEEDANIKGVKEWAKTVNQQDPLTMLEVQTQNSIASLKRVLGKIKTSNQESAQQQSQQDQDFALQIEDSKKALVELESSLRINEINAEYDRKLELVGLEPEEQQIEPEDTGMRDLLESQKVNNDVNSKSQDRQLKREELMSKERMNRLDNKTMLQNKVAGETSKNKKK